MPKEWSKEEWLAWQKEVLRGEAHEESNTPPSQDDRK